jgi:hypothetical protein
MPEEDAQMTLVRGGVSLARARQIIAALKIDAFHSERLDLAPMVEDRLKEMVIAGEHRFR